MTVVKMSSAQALHKKPVGAVSDHDFAPCRKHAMAWQCGIGVGDASHKNRSM